MTKRFLSVFMLLFLITAMFCGCNPSNKSYIAKVNDEPITLAEYNYYFEIVKLSIASTAGVSVDDSGFWANTDINGKSVVDIAKETALDDAIKATIVAQQAKKEGFSVDKPSIEHAKKSKAAIYLSEHGVTDQGLTSALNKAYMQNKLFEKYQLENKISVTDEETEKFYNEKFVTVKHILFLTSDPATGNVVRSGEEAYALASDTINKLNSGEDFDVLANTLSEDTGLATNPNGYTFTNNGQMVAEFETAAFELEVGKLSPPVKTSYGYHVLRREKLLPFEEFKLSNNYSSITSQLITNKQNELVESWRSSAKVEKNEAAYAKITID